MRRLGSGSPWEDQKDLVPLTTSKLAASLCTRPKDGVLGKGGAAEQTRQALEDVVAALGRVDATVADVVRTRIYVTDIAQWQTVGRVHGEFFGAHRPATAMVEVAKLIDPAMLVEVECDAVVRS